MNDRGTHVPLATLEGVMSTTDRLAREAPRRVAGAVPPRSAWVEVDLGVLERNFRLIREDLPPAVRLLYVVKDDAYGLGATEAARVGLRCGVSHLAVVTLREAAELREARIEAPILLLGDRLAEEYPWVLELDLEPALGAVEAGRCLDRLAQRAGRRIAVHVKVNTGMNRFGLPWRDADVWSRDLAGLKNIEVAGVFSHFAQSDEADKTFAREQLGRFRQALEALRDAGIRPKYCHHANSGGFLDLPEGHLDLVRVGILAHGVYPSSVCRRLAGLEPVMTVKARVVAIQRLEPGDSVGYGMHWRASRRSRIGVLPLGYGDGFPRMRNEGHVLLRGRPVPIVGGVTMDAIMVDVTDLAGVEVGEEAVVMGRQGEAEITPYEVAAWRRSVTYEALLGWRHRLPRVYRRG